MSIAAPFKRFKVTIYSENPDELEKFYSQTLGLELDRKMELENDYGYVFKLGDHLELFIAKHSEIHGQNREVVRHIFDLKVDSVSEWFLRVKDVPGVQIIADPFQAPCSVVATFTDPEGNCWQFSE